MSYDPTWKHIEKDLHNPDGNIAGAAAEAFQKERDKELQNSAVARNWEAGRKEEWKKNKPEYIKKKRQEALEKDPSYHALQLIKNAGRIDMKVIPTAGYILVEPLEPEVDKTDSGIYIPQNQDESPNKGTVIAVGDEQNAMGIIKQPAQPGDTVLFKRFAGIKMTVEGKECAFMQFGDILARLED